MRVKKNYRSFHCRSRSHNAYKSTAEIPKQTTRETSYVCLYLLTSNIFYSLQYLLVGSKCYFQYSPSTITYSKSTIETLE